MKVFVAHNVTHHVEGMSRRVLLSELIGALRTAGVEVCDPEETAIPHHQYAARFDYCLREISSADLLIVDASARVGLGVGAEMMFAKQHRISVFAICPENSYYRKVLSESGSEKEWLHPFIYGLATKVFANVGECVAEVAVRGRLA